MYIHINTYIHRKLEKVHTLYVVYNPCKPVSFPHSCAAAALPFLAYSPGFNVVCCPRQALWELESTHNPTWQWKMPPDPAQLVYDV